MDSHCSLRGECAHYREEFELKSFQNAKPAENTEMLPLWIYLYVHLSLQIRSRSKGQLGMSPHLKGCLFILDTSDDPSELERFKERFKVGDPFQCHIRSVNHERKQVDLSRHPKTSDEQFKKGGLLGRRITRVFAGVGRHTVQGRWESFGKVHGFVKNVTEKGCFVVLAPSLEARIQLKNLSNSFVQNPAEMFPPGKVISGRILSIEPLSGHIEMSLAATTSQDSSCLCHVSEVSYDFIQDLSTLYKVGQWVQVKILKVDAETKRISLRMKASYLTPEDGIEPMEEEAINEEPSNTNMLMDNDEREEEDYLDLASKRFPQLCMEEKLLQKDQPPETKDDFERLVAASPNNLDKVRAVAERALEKIIY
ncbi:hypothetical protein SELMODRAFT_415410 [Selaginella moellendorffii]|uniref:S1 motif domain-containing protein n=1 Tax=Selaginella moellendorffii TaxID=88036 RepID=D8RW17_SELML|nr:hypothetical protein SELMODRAFT_415410 [Selaginella moellendorffii]